MPLSLSGVLLLATSMQCGAQHNDPQTEIALHAQKAQEFLKQNRPDLAIPEFRAIVALDPNNVDARGNLGVLLFFQTNYTAAVPELRSTLKLRPSLWKIQALLGMAEKRTGDPKGAIADLEKAIPNLQDQKIHVQAGMELIEIYSNLGELDKAGAIVDSLRRLYPTDVDVLYASYRLHSDLASESMLSLSLVAPNSARMHQIMAHEMARHGDDEGAIRNYREALKLDPSIPGLRFELAEMLNSSSTHGDQREAEQEYKAALAANQFDEKSEFRLGDIDYKRGDTQAAYQHYARAVELQPNDADADVGLAKTLILMKQAEKAQQLLEHAVQLDPTNATAHFRLSTIYRMAGRDADAKRELEEYQKYKDLKEKLREIYHEMRVKPDDRATDETEAQK